MVTFPDRRDDREIFLPVPIEISHGQGKWILPGME